MAERTELLADVVGFEGELKFDPSKPNGTPHKSMDVSRLTCMGWAASIPRREGIDATYAWYLDQSVC